MGMYFRYSVIDVDVGSPIHSLLPHVTAIGYRHDGFHPYRLGDMMTSIRGYRGLGRFTWFSNILIPR